MPIMQWNTTLDVGVPAMNAEHRDILDAMNRIYDAHAAGARGQAMNDDVARLGAIVVRHFADEERFMEQIGFPGLASHRIIHQRLLEKFTEHADAIKRRGGCADDAFFGFLMRWLTAHIHGIDAKYGDHAQATKATHRQARA